MAAHRPCRRPAWGYVRLALVENEHRIRHAARNVKAFLRNADAILAAKEGRRNAS